MVGRRWSDGLHQAVEAKENVRVREENQTVASITFQNYFRMYSKLSGMTGTAETEAAEFYKIYKLEVVVIPPNKPMRRIENTDMVYRTEVEKFRNAANEIKEFNAKNKWRKQGIAIIPVKYGSGYNFLQLEQSAAIVVVNQADGTIVIHQGGVEIGQGCADHGQPGDPARRGSRQHAEQAAQGPWPRRRDRRTVRRGRRVLQERGRQDRGGRRISPAAAGPQLALGGADGGAGREHD